MINNEVYLINYATGTCGTFIRYILQQILAQEGVYNTTYQQELLFNTPYADAHEIDFELINSETYTFTAVVSGNKHLYENCICVEHNNPIVFNTHNPPNWDIFFKKFCNGKNIIISFCKDTEKIAATFAYFKYFKKYDSMFTLIDKKTYPYYFVSQWLKHEYPYSYKYPLQKPNIYKDNIFEIKLYDLLFDKEKVLGLLSEITSRPIPSYVEKSYDNYINAQIRTYPWLFN